MRRLFRVLLPLTVLVPVIATSVPVSATDPVPTPGYCAGEFTLTSPLRLPGAAPSASGSFTLSFGGIFGVCTALSSDVAVSSINGWLSGWCGLALGDGYRSDGRPIGIAWTGTSLEISGTSLGVLHLSRPADGCLPDTGTSTNAFFGVIASDTVDSCTGIGTMSLSSGGSGVLGFYVGFGIGTCVAAFGSFSATGTIRGCGIGASGDAITADGRTFAFIWAPGDVLVLSGDVVGAISVTPDLFSGASCAFGGSWLARGDVVKRR